MKPLLNLILHACVIVSVLFSTSFAQTLSCPRGQGVWTNSEGVQKCRPCPDVGLFTADAPLKLPQNCLVLSFGVFLTIKTFTEFVESKKRLEKADEFIEKLDPLLTVLKQQLASSSRSLEAVQISFDEVKLQNKNLMEREKTLNGKVGALHTMLYVVGSIAILGAAFTAYTVTK